MTMDAVPRLKKGCRLSPTDPEVLLLPERLLYLRGSAQAILPLCDGRRSVLDVIAELRQRFPETASGTIAADTLFLLKDLEKKGALDL
jgi:pyrroloquinoline quinone biosynthesis protein D